MNFLASYNYIYLYLPSSFFSSSPPPLFTINSILIFLFISAPGEWRQLELSQLSSSSHPSCRQWKRPTQRSETFAIRRSPCFRAQTSASSCQSFPAPTSAFTSPCWRPHQGHHSHTWHYTSCHHHTCFRQTFTSCPAASQNTWKRGGQIWDNRADGGCDRVSCKKDEGFFAVDYSVLFTCIV